MSDSTQADETRTRRTMAPVDRWQTWMDLAGEAYRRIAADFRQVDDAGWTAPTPCDGWTVRDMGGHLVGAMRSAASLRETASQQRAVAKRVKSTGEQEVDALTATQIERTADLSPAALVEEMARLVGPAVAGRRRLPGFIRRRAGLDVRMGAIDERWTLEHLLGCILTRDAWLHRVDLADSLGTSWDPDAHDATIVGDVAVEWAERHGQPVHLVLTGGAGGELRTGTGGPTVELDALEFCRVLSGRRTHDHPLLAHPVPF